MVIEQNMFTEKELRAAMVPFVNVDDRWLPWTIGFLVELASDECELFYVSPHRASRSRKTIY
jgi:hypothetical protein